MTFGRLNIPASLLTAQEEGKLVIFAGAGVSMGPPSDLPGFVALTRAIAQRELTEFEKGHLDQLLGQLKHEGRDVHALAVRELSRPGSAPTHLHRQLVGLFRRKENVRIVTTNFDPHFVTAVAGHENLPIYKAPALPRGGDFHGLVHLHGALSGPERDLVLTDEDFGRAYLTEGWARTFLEQLFRNYVVLFVGYSHTDPPMHYLARGLPIESPPRRFVITPEPPERWQRLGIGVISYVKDETDDPHRPLSYGVTQWVSVTRGSQFGLNDQITQLLARPDPTTLNDEEASLIEWSVTHETSVASFVRNARGLVWVDWLDRRGLLARFFDPSTRFPNWHDRQIASWLADRLLEGPSEKAYEIVRRQGGRFCRELHRWLAHQLGDRTLPLAWTFLVLQQTERDDQDSQYVIGTKLRDLVRNDLSSFWPVFRALTDPQIETDAIGFGGPGEPGACRVVIVGDASVLWSVWREAIAPLAEEIGLTLLALLMEQLARATQLARACGDEQFHLRATGGRSRMARVDHHYHRESRLDVLVDMLVELISTLARTRALPEANITQWLAAEDTIVRRLGLHALGESADVGREMKLEWAQAAAGRYSADTPEKREADALVRWLEQPVPETVPATTDEPALPQVPETLPPVADLLQLSADRLRRVVLTARLAPNTVIASVRELVTATATNSALESHALWDLLLGRRRRRRSLATATATVLPIGSNTSSEHGTGTATISAQR